jgi:hypothetical protein
MKSRTSVTKNAAVKLAAVVVAIAAKLAVVVEDSKNSKIGTMSATYTAYQTCPKSCKLRPDVQSDGSFKQSACYASQDLVAIQMHRLTTASVDVSFDAIERAECEGIESLTGKNILRLKVGGDTVSDKYARALAKACAVYTSKFGQLAYTYTHNWLNIARESFGQISVLASCDSVAEVKQAKARGYATATVVSEFPNGAKLFEIDGEKMLPCPNQINNEVKCTACKLCTRDAELKARNITVAFKSHGRQSESLSERLIQIGQ